jgi:hypothetical protein
MEVLKLILGEPFAAFCLIIALCLILRELLKLITK